MPEFPKQRHRNSCGATVVAYLAGVDLERAEQVNGPGLTTTNRLLGSLALFGILTDPIRRRRPDQWELPGDVVRVRWTGTSRSHWAVYLGGGEYYDPARGERVTGFDGGRVTSFIPVRK